MISIRKTWIDKLRIAVMQKHVKNNYAIYKINYVLFHAKNNFKLKQMLMKIIVSV